MALLLECMQQCARKMLDTADIVREGDVTPVEMFAYRLAARITCRLPTSRELIGLVNRSAFIVTYVVKLPQKPISGPE
jgi:hypothetical protein